MSSNDVWLTKYKPTTINDIQINALKSHATKIKDWLCSFNAKKTEISASSTKKKQVLILSGCMCVIGNVGSGKNVIVDVAANEANYNLIYLTEQDFLLYENDDNLLSEIVKDNKNCAIVIDKIEGFDSDKQKITLAKLQKINSISYVCPLIFIMNKEHKKFKTTIKEKCFNNVITISNIDQNDMINIVNHISEKEGLKYEKKNELEIKETIIINIDNDIRKLISILQELHYYFGKKIMTLNKIEEYFEFSDQIKEGTDELFIASKKLLTYYTNPQDCIYLYNTDKSIINTMIQENYIKVLLNKKAKPNVDKLKLLATISDFITKGDIVENYIFGSQNWGLHDVHCYFSTTIPSNIIYNNTTNTECYSKLEYPKDLGSTSGKSINKKNILTSMKHFQNLSNDNIIYLNELCIKFIDNKDFAGLVKLIDPYLSNNIVREEDNSSKSKSKRVKKNKSIEEEKLNSLYTLLKINKHINTNKTSKKAKDTNDISIFPPDVSNAIIEEFKKLSNQINSL